MASPENPDAMLSAVQRTIATLSPDQQEGVERVAGVLRDVIRTANKRAGAVGDLALMLLAAQRAKGPIE